MVEEQTPEEREAGRAVALQNLDSKLWDYALPKLVDLAQFGQIATNAINRGFPEVLSEVPTQEIYEQLFLPALASENGAVTQPYIQNNSARILQESLMRIKVEDVLAYFDSTRSVKEDYQGKYISDLSEADAGNIIQGYMSHKTTKKVSEILSDAADVIPSGLEEMLCEIPEPAAA
jgi:hypothetical protein